MAFVLTHGGLRAGEDEIQVTLGPGYCSLPDLARGMDGLGGGLEVSYGLTAFWGLSAGGFVGYHFGDEVADAYTGTVEAFEPTLVTSIWLGPRFNLDVFTVVPYLGLAPEILWTAGELVDEQEELDFGLRWTVGLDYRPQRDFSLGFEVNYHSFLRQPLDYPVFISTMFRLSYHHGLDDL